MFTFLSDSHTFFCLCSVSEVRLEAEENNPELSMEQTVFNNSVAEPKKTNDDDLVNRKTRPSR